MFWLIPWVVGDACAGWYLVLLRKCKAVQPFLCTWLFREILNCIAKINMAKPPAFLSQDRKWPHFGGVVGTHLAVEKHPYGWSLHPSGVRMPKMPNEAFLAPLGTAGGVTTWGISGQGSLESGSLLGLRQLSRGKGRRANQWVHCLAVSCSLVRLAAGIGLPPAALCLITAQISPPFPESFP